MDKENEEAGILKKILLFLFKRKIPYHYSIIALGAGTALLSLLPYLGQLWWGLDLFSHFRLQYFIILTIVVALTLYPFKKWKTAIVFSIFLLINLLEIAPLYFGDARPETDKPLRCLSVNVLTANKEYSKVIGLIEQTSPDIIVFQEVSAKWLDMLRPATKGYPYIKAEARSDNFGIAIYSRIPFEKAQVREDENQVPFIVADFKINENNLRIVGVHTLPPRNSYYSTVRNQQLELLAEISRNTDGDIMMIGDFNISPWSVYFKKLLNDGKLKNSQNGFGVQPSWPAFPHLAPMRIPIDHCLVSDGIAIHDRQTGESVGSDHFPVIIDFSL